METDAELIAAQEKYIKLLYDLLPFGLAWSRDKDTVLYKVISALAIEFARIDIRAKFLNLDVDPSQTTELIDDYERVLGLPDDCSPEALTIAQRQNQIVEKLTRLGGQSKQFLIDAAAKLGYTITIDEFPLPFQVGRSVVGEALYNGAWQFHFVVNGSLSGGGTFQVGKSVVGEALGSFGSELLECTIDRLKPANTTVSFEYS